MKNKMQILFYFLILNSVAFAAGDGSGHGSPKDLLWPLFNIAVLGSFLIYKLKKPLTEHFVTKSSEIKSGIDRAEVKSREAELMLNKQKEKLANLNSEIDALKKSAQSDLTKFEELTKEEFSNKEEKLKVDSLNKLETQKRELYDLLAQNILDQVIVKSKNTLTTNKEVGISVTKNLLKAIR